MPLTETEAKYILQCVKTFETLPGQSDCIAMHAVTEALKTLFNQGVEVGRRQSDGDKILRSMN